MLLFKLDKHFNLPDGGNEGGNTTDTTSTDTSDNTSNDTSLESIMTGGNSTQTEPASEPGKGKEEPEPTTENAPAWIQQLPKDMRTDDINQFAQISDLVKAYKGLAADKDKQSQAPGKDAKPEEVQAFYEKLGKPKTADEYSIKGNEGDEAGTKLFKDAAFAANLTDEQAKEMHKALESIAVNELNHKQQLMLESKVSTEKLLHDTYGSKYQEKLNSLSKGMTTFVSDTLKKELINAGLIFNPDIVKMLITLGDATAESGSTVNGNGTKEYVPLSQGGLFDFKDL